MSYVILGKIILNRHLVHRLCPPANVLSVGLFTDGMGGKKNVYAVNGEEDGYSFLDTNQRALPLKSDLLLRRPQGLNAFMVPDLVEGTRRAYHTSNTPIDRNFQKVNNGRNCYQLRDIFGNLTSTRSAGHSKWANIRHIKAAKDGAKSQIAGKMVSLIKIAIREGGGTDPKFNNQLFRIIERANKADVPKSTIDNAIKNAIKAHKEGSLVLFEAKGPGNFMMLIEAFTDNPKRTVLEVNYCFKKFGGQLSDKIAAAFFDRKGVIMVKPEGSLNTYEAVEEAAIMAEAEEVHEEPDEDGSPMYKIICDKGTMYTVRKQMVADHPDAQIDNAIYHYIPKPHSMTPLSGEALDVAVKLVDAMERVAEVERVYTNIEVVGDS